VIDKAYWRDFSVSRQGIFFAAAVEKGNFQRILHLGKEGNAPVEVARIGPRGPKLGPLSVSADGRYLLYERLDQVENDIYMVENFDGVR
jgi:hypothetical protein